MKPKLKKHMKSNCFNRILKGETNGFFVLTAFFFLSLFILKCVEIFSLKDLVDTSYALLLVASATYTLILASWVAVALFVLFLALRYISEKVAYLVINILYSLLFISELSLVIYYFHNGLLYGSELLVRPVQEQWMAVEGATGIILPIILPIIIIFLFIFVEKKLSPVLRHCSVVICAMIAVFLILSQAFYLDNLIDKRYKAPMINKTFYCLNDNIYYLRTRGADDFYDNNGDVIVNTEIIKRFIGDNQAITTIKTDSVGLLYPLERKDTIQDNLSRYFSKTSKTPNIVILLVESLGDEFLNCGLMPFVDSLASKSLYWKNCLSATPRSFGAATAITASAMGPESFQYGNIPDHNSIFQILASNGYEINAFYGGLWPYDNIADYINVQNPDYVSTLFETLEPKKNPQYGISLGVHDSILFDDMIKRISKNDTTPQLNFAITIDLHEEIALDEKSNDKFIQQAKDALARYGKRKVSNPKDRLACACYDDYCLKKFFSDYSKLPFYENTIFVVTGDHSSGLYDENPLSFHHVPLIIWSPLLKESYQFNSIVTHYDITPALVRMLKCNYGIKTPETVHWVSNGLDVSSKASVDRTMLIVTRDRIPKFFMFDKYLYSAAMPREKERLYEIDTNIVLREVRNDSLLKKAQLMMNDWKYIIAYTHDRNRLTEHPLFSKADYLPISVYKLDSLLCVTPEIQPSVSGPAVFEVLPTKCWASSDSCSNIMVRLNAEVQFNENLWKNDYMDISFCFQGKEKSITREIVYHALKSTPEVINPDSTYNLCLEKTFRLDEGVDNACGIEIITRNDDDHWKPGSSMLLKNIRVEIKGRYK